MHNNENTTLATFNHSPIGNLSIGRLCTSIVAGGIVTFALFVVMHALIDQDNVMPPLVEPIFVPTFILDIPEEKTNPRVRLKPIPELKLQPIAQVKLLNESTNEPNFSSEVSIPPVSIRKMAFNMGTVDQQPSPRIRVDPRYPARALTNGIEGFVKLTFGVSASGEVVDIQVIESAPRNTFDQAAKQALRKWRYQPKIVSGSPVGMSGLQVQLDFSLANN